MASMCLFSQVRGVVRSQGQPVAQALVVREYRWAWKDETGSDQVTTNERGEFSLPPIVRSSFLGGLLPHEPSVKQRITIRYQGRDYEAWTLYKRNYDDQGELKGRPIVLSCTLEAPVHESGDVRGICDLQ